MNCAAAQTHTRPTVQQQQSSRGSIGPSTAGCPRPEGYAVTTTTAIIEQAITSTDQNTVYCQRDLWYFRAENGEEIGPFRYRSEAESGLERFREQAIRTI
jgi:hypothetical protein